MRGRLAGALPWEPTQTEIARIKEHIATPYDEAALYPLLLYRGQGGVGRARAMVNYFVAGMETNTSTISSLAWRSEWHGYVSDHAHLSGIHYPMGNNAQPLHHWATRLLRHPEVTGVVPRLTDYLQYLRSDGGLHEVRLAPIVRWTPHRSALKPWRFQQAPRDTFEVPRMWPFISTQTPADLDGLSLLEAIEHVIPEGMYFSVREDLCQDLLVAVLSGDLEQAQLRERLPEFMRKAKTLSPMKYGWVSLDATRDDKRTRYDTVPGRDSNEFAYLR